MSSLPRPNLFLVGAMKSGSSSLTRHLRAHPSIFMARRPKEPSYFVDREELRRVYPAMAKLGFSGNEERYLELFAEAADCPIVGEASQNYARKPRVTGVPERIADFNPQARILYIMRDPIERTISHYWYMVNFYGEGRAMLEAVRDESDYRDTSYYAMQLAPYRQLFGAPNVKAMTLEELRTDPAKTLADIYRWLGVADDFVPETIGTRANVTPETVSIPGPYRFLHGMRHSRIWRYLGPMVPARLRKIGRDLSESRVSRREVPTADVVEFLRPIQQEQTRELEEMLGRTFSDWHTLRGGEN